ncbi:hypothetical protein, partial [Raoultella planticola]|uniref:hypothetical protein n=1 Tax=Raoultella planticola TaxID=575 RepID=UPI001F353FAE
FIGISAFNRAIVLFLVKTPEAAHHDTSYRVCRKRDAFRKISKTSFILMQLIISGDRVTPSRGMNRKSAMRHPDLSMTRCHHVNSGLNRDKFLTLVISPRALMLCVF